MNWKKEKWQVGQEVYLVIKGMFTRDIKYDTGIISHVGTKLLKVRTKPKMELTFKDNNITSGHIASFGYTYEVYKSKEDYERYVQEECTRKTTIALITDKLSGLSLKELDKILNIIEEEI